MGALHQTLASDLTAAAVYARLYAHADDDGFVDAAAGNLAIALTKPLRTINGAMARLEKAGKIYLICKENGTNMFPRWVVVEKCLDED